MKTLVAYYSRTGITKKVAGFIAEALEADIEEIVDTKNRKGVMRFMVACKDGIMKKTGEIGPVEKTPSDYDLVVIGTPVWANTFTPAVRKYLADYGQDLKKAAVFCTTAKSGIESTTRGMSEMIDGETIAAAGFREKHVKKDEHIEALQEFISKIRPA